MAYTRNFLFLSSKSINFHGETVFLGVHDFLQTKDGNATWLNEIFPIIDGPKKHIAEVSLWMLHTLDLCWVIAGEYDMYLAGKLKSHPNLTYIYIAYCP